VPFKKPPKPEMTPPRLPWPKHSFNSKENTKLSEIFYLIQINIPHK
jgi:hypothetical protein